MSLFIATGSNLEERLVNLNKACEILMTEFSFVAKSRVYESSAVDYLNQPDFYNQVLEFKTPNQTPETVMKKLLEIEVLLGRNRSTPKGPRIIDLDLLFWDEMKINTSLLQIPHPRLFERSFVVLPLSELPGFKNLQSKYHFNTTFDNTATPIS